MFLGKQDLGKLSRQAGSRQAFQASRIYQSKSCFQKLPVKGAFAAGPGPGNSCPEYQNSPPCCPRPASLGHFQKLGPCLCMLHRLAPGRCFQAVPGVSRCWPSRLGKKLPRTWALASPYQRIWLGDLGRASRSCLARLSKEELRK